MSEYNRSAESQIAVALKYNPDKDNAPVVVAAGNGHLAQQIINLANKNQVPVYQDNGAASLLSHLQLGAQIPPELYQVVAEIYAYILKANHQAQSSAEFEPIDPNGWDQIKNDDPS